MSERPHPHDPNGEHELMRQANEAALGAVYGDQGTLDPHAELFAALDEAVGDDPNRAPGYGSLANGLAAREQSYREEHGLPPKTMAGIGDTATHAALVEDVESAFTETGDSLVPGGENPRASSAERLSELTSLMKPGINKLVGNEELETAYLRYNAAVLDERFADPKCFKVEQLPAREREQIDAMVGSLVERGAASAEILQERLNRVRVTFVERHTSAGQDVGGEFHAGVAYVASEDLTPAQKNHALLHEVAHGLTQIEAIAVMDGGNVGDFGSALARSRTTRTPQATVALKRADESIVDTLAMSVSDLGGQSDHPSRGGYEPSAAELQFGYVQGREVFARLTVNNPDIAAEMWRAAFSEGVSTSAQGETFASAWSVANQEMNNGPAS